MDINDYINNKGEQINVSCRMCVCMCMHACSVVPYSLQPYGLQPTRLLCPWNFPVKNTGVGSHSLLQGIFPTQGSNLDLPHCMGIYHLSHKG